MSKKKVWPEYKAQYLTDYFVDYAGHQRMFTLCAVSVPMEALGVINFPEIEDVYVFSKELRLGMAVQCHDDKADENLGKTIAYGKALKYNDHVMCVTSPGMINTVMVDALLKQEAEYFKRNPESYIAGYKQKKFKWEAKHKDNPNNLLISDKFLVNDLL